MKLQKPSSCIPQWILFQVHVEPRLLFGKRMHTTFLPVRFWNVCLWQFFVCFKAFTTFWYDTKNQWERKLLFFRFFYLFWMSGRPLSSSTESPSKLDWSMLIIAFLLTFTLLLTFFVTWELHKQSWTRTCREGIWTIKIILTQTSFYS